jgi:hypothetical protein
MASESPPGEYVYQIPTSIPEGYALVHNHAAPRKTLGLGGFRAWLQRHDATIPPIVPCTCSWSKWLNGLPHYRVDLKAARKQSGHENRR